MQLLLPFSFIDEAINYALCISLRKLEHLDKVDPEFARAIREVRKGMENK